VVRVLVSTPPPFYAYATSGAWHGVVSSTGARYPLDSNETVLNGGVAAFSMTRPGVTFVFGLSRGRFRIQIDFLPGPRRTVFTREQPTSPPVFAPDGRVVYATGTTIRYVGGPTIPVTGLPRSATIGYVAPSPRDPRSFALQASWGNGRQKTLQEALYLVSPSRTRRVPITFDAYSELVQPRWSPDGTHVAFIRAGTDRGGDLYVVDADGAHVRRLTQSTRVTGPAWSPNGRLIAFTQRYGYRAGRSNGVPEVAVVDVATGAQRRLTHTPRLPPPIPGAPYNDQYIPPGTAAGAWSPDGRSIAVVTQNRSLGVVPAAGGLVRVLYTLRGPRLRTGLGLVSWPHR
jgi:hypothetical protein